MSMARRSDWAAAPMTVNQRAYAPWAIRGPRRYKTSVLQWFLLVLVAALKFGFYLRKR